MSRRRLLITGATGGLGQALVREALARGHHVRATGRSAEAGAELGRAGAEFVLFDLVRQQSAMEDLVAGCQSVIHAAGLSASWGKRQVFEAANVAVTASLLRAAQEQGVERFIFVSSPSIFAAFRDRMDIAADHPPARRQLNHYSRTKLLAEQLVLAQPRLGMACCALRPRALVGAGDRVILPRLAALAARRRMPLPRGGRALIELTDLRDAAWAICEAEAHGQALHGRAINISGGRPAAVREVAQALAQAMGKSPALVHVPAMPARLLAQGLELVARLRGAEDEPVLTRYTLATLAYSQTFDPAPARDLLGYAPRFDALETLLAEARKLAGERHGA